MTSAWEAGSATRRLVMHCGAFTATCAAGFHEPLHLAWRHCCELCRLCGICGALALTASGALAGAASLSAWQGRETDGSMLWGLHSRACGELAEAVALCLDALHTFGIELAGSAAAKAGLQVPPQAFSSIAGYLKAKVR